MSHFPIRLAVVIPTLNEEQSLPATLKSLLKQTEPPDRLLVADGGSYDGTVAIARKFGADVLTIAERGRGGQIATAAATVTEHAILVAHADMFFPSQALADVRRKFHDDPSCPGGCLGHRFDREAFIYTLIAFYDGWRARRGESYGDQAQFFRRELLARVGGFPDQPIMEDVELSGRLRQLGRPCYLDVPVTVSARRFERLGWRRVLWRNWRLRSAYRRGGAAACAAIYRRYYGWETAMPRTRNDQRSSLARPLWKPLSRHWLLFSGASTGRLTAGDSPFAGSWLRQPLLWRRTMN